MAFARILSSGWRSSLLYWHPEADARVRSVGRSWKG